MEVYKSRQFRTWKKIDHRAQADSYTFIKFPPKPIDRSKLSAMGIEKDSPFTSGDEESKDVEEQMNVGYVEELRRDFSIWSLGSLCLCLVSKCHVSESKYLSHPLSSFGKG